MTIDSTKALSDAQKSLLAELDTLFTAEGITLTNNTIQKVDNCPEHIPLSVAQEQLWFLNQVNPESAFYNIPFAIRLFGKLNIDALHNALQDIVNRHEVFRTTFQVIDGQPVQHIAPALSLPIPITVIDQTASDRGQAEINQFIHRELLRPFELMHDTLLRAYILQVTSKHHILLMVIHHIIYDGWSSKVLFGEIATLYNAYQAQQPLTLPQPRLQYADFAIWQRQWQQSNEYKQQLAYWSAQLAGVPKLDLPTDHPRPPVSSNQGGRLVYPLPSPLVADLQKISQEESVTMFMALLTSFQILLARYSDQTDIAIGIPFADRERAELADVIGFFVNTLVVRNKVTGQTRYCDLLKQVRQTCLEAFSNGNIPFPKLVEALQLERTFSHNPLFQVMFSMLERDEAALELVGITTERFPVADQTAKFDLSLDIFESDNGLVAEFEYSSDLFEEKTIWRMATHWEAILSQIAIDPQQIVAELSLLSSAEKNQLLYEWNATKTDYPPPMLVHQLIANRAAQRPEATAVVYEDELLTYGQLTVQVDALAIRLHQQGVQLETVVGVCLERGIAAVVAQLAVLKAGGVCLPLDPLFPTERILTMLENASAPLLLTQQHLKPRFADYIKTIFCIDADSPPLPDPPPTLPRVQPDNLALLIYTSGSTGIPKGAMITHANFCNYSYFFSEQYDLPKRINAHLQMASIAFDVFMADMLRALGSGAKLVICPRETLLEPHALYTLMREQGIDSAEFVPAVLKLLAEYTEKHNKTLDFMRVLAAGADTWYVADYLQVRRQVSSDTRLLNVYGLTEATIDNAHWGGANTPETLNAVMPIGHPIANTQLYILNQWQRPVPVGVFGELYIGGAGVGRGYLNQPGLTAIQFIPDPYSNTVGTRLYRSGDRVRYQTDATIEFQGRIDNQVKIRGFRIELGEIESTLLSYPLIQKAVVSIHENAAKQKQIIGYLVLEPGQTVEIAPLNDFLRQQLPDYMIPAGYVLLKKLPLTPNGKVNRKSLPVYAGPESGHEGGYQPPENVVENQVANIWTAVLGLEKIDRRDSFFQIGGHSLLATQIISRLRTTLDSGIPLRLLFETPTLSEFADRVAKIQQTAQASKLPDIPLIPRTGQHPLSFSQQRLWFLEQFDPLTPMYNIPLIFEMEGNIQKHLLEQALNGAVERHESLRTHFLDQDGIPVQVINDELYVDIPVFDLQSLALEQQASEIERHIDEEAQLPFDLTKSPLIRTRFLQTAANKAIFLFTLHHIIADGWSLHILLNDLEALYKAYQQEAVPSLTPLPIQYVDFVVWQRTWLKGDALQDQLTYWQNQLADLPRLTLPYDFPVPAQRTRQGNAQMCMIPPATTEQLKQFGGEEGTTLSMVLLALYKILLARYSQMDDIVVGTPIAGRVRSELEDLIGFFVNMLVLRSNLAGQPTFREFLQHVRQISIDAYTHQDVSFEQLVEVLQPERSLTYSPLFQAVFIFNNTPEEKFDLPDVAVRRLPGREELTKFDLALEITEMSDGALSVSIFYDTELFANSTIARMLAHYQMLVQTAMQKPETNVWALPLLTASEIATYLPEQDVTSLLSGQDCLHTIFESHVRRTPHAIALTYEDQQLSYQALNARANQLAHYLLQMGVQLDTFVAVLLDRTPDLIVAILAILKAGAAYLPIDPATPSDRATFMLADTQASILITDTSYQERVSLPQSSHQILLDKMVDTLAQEPDYSPAVSVSLANLAYVIYTSGSTGVPKGVMVPHANVLNLFAATAVEYEFSAADVWTLFHSIAFDFSVWELWGPLLHGGRLVIVPYWTSRSPEKFLETLQAEKITVLNQTPSAFQTLLLAITHAPQTRHLHTHLRWIIFGGEALDVTTLTSWFVQYGDRHTQLVNMYGITETTVHVTIYPLTGSSRQQLNHYNYSRIGNPINAWQTYVLNQAQTPMPTGISGELFVGGAGLARGYLNRPALTATRFVPHPFSAIPGQRLYRTGDSARWLPDGSLEYLGRLDTQVKIRGFRIELGEIESVLNQLPNIQSTAVVVKQFAADDKRLLAYVTLKQPENPLDSQAVRMALRRQLPGYMIPADILVLPALPLTTNGKLDRQKLAQIENSPATKTASHIDPRNETEQKLVTIWQNVLNISPISVLDDFFELGGHSLLATQIIAQIHKTFHVALPLRRLFETPTIGEIALSIQQYQAEQNLTTNWQSIVPTVDDHSDVQSLLTRIDDMSPEEITALLREYTANEDD